MTQRALRWRPVLLLAVALATWGTPQAQDTPAYKCVRRGGVTYSQAPCAGGRPVGQGRARSNVHYETAPQDRAKAARRAALGDAARRECRALDVTLQVQEQELRSRGSGATLQDEMPLVRSKKRYRELRC